MEITNIITETNVLYGETVRRMHLRRKQFHGLGLTSNGFYGMWQWIKNVMGEKGVEVKPV